MDAMVRYRQFAMDVAKAMNDAKVVRPKLPDETRGVAALMVIYGEDSAGPPFGGSVNYTENGGWEVDTEIQGGEKVSFDQ